LPLFTQLPREGAFLETQEDVRARKGPGLCNRRLAAVTVAALRASLSTSQRGERPSGYGSFPRLLSSAEKPPDLSSPLVPAELVVDTVRPVMLAESEKEQHEEVLRDHPKDAMFSVASV
jgi:hypothetical protein